MATSPIKTESSDEVPISHTKESSLPIGVNLAFPKSNFFSQSVLFSRTNSSEFDLTTKFEFAPTVKVVQTLVSTNPREEMSDI